MLIVQVYIHIGMHTVRMTATSRWSNVVNHFDHSMSTPASAVAVQMLSSSSPATQVVSRGGSVDNEKVECVIQLVIEFRFLMLNY